MDQVCVFPLDGVVLFPTTTLPLYLFEPRYLQMFKDAVQNKRPIAICPTAPFKGKIVGYGHPALIQQRDDGTQAIVIRGQGRARLVRPVQAEPFWIYEIQDEPYADQIEPGQQFVVNRMRRQLQQWAEKEIPLADQRSALLESLHHPRLVLESLAMLQLKDPDVRQKILEFNDINEAIQFVMPLL